MQVLTPRFARPGDDIRLDVLLLAPFSWPRHLKNVWHG
jgi:putative endonuclease